MKGTTSTKEPYAIPESLRRAFDFWVKSPPPAKQVFRDFVTESSEIRIPQKLLPKNQK
jgi:hypothetical protein